MHRKCSYLLVLWVRSLCNNKWKMVAQLSGSWEYYILQLGRESAIHQMLDYNEALHSGTCGECLHLLLHGQWEPAFTPLCREQVKLLLHLLHCPSLHHRGPWASKQHNHLKHDRSQVRCIALHYTSTCSFWLHSSKVASSCAEMFDREGGEEGTPVESSSPSAWDWHWSLSSAVPMPPLAVEVGGGLVPR